MWRLTVLAASMAVVGRSAHGSDDRSRDRHAPIEPMRGQAAAASLIRIPSHRYTFVYFGGQVHEDLQGRPVVEPLEPGIGFASFDGSRLFEIYQLEGDGRVLPEELIGLNERPFSAIVRYHYDNPEEIARARNFIAANQGGPCRDFLVVSYPTTSVEQVEELRMVVNSFRGPRVLSIGRLRDPSNIAGPNLIELFYFYAQYFPRHAPPPPITHLGRVT